jgi:hypothetical protein
MLVINKLNINEITENSDQCSIDSPKLPFDLHLKEQVEEGLFEENNKQMP